MANDDWHIVPERDEALTIARSGKKPDARKAKGGNEGTKEDVVKPRAERKGGGFALLVAFIAVGAAGYLYYELQGSVSDQQRLAERVAALEGRLSVTDESLSQSGAAMQALLQDHDSQLETHMSEIRKLWGVAYDTNRTAISALQDTSNSLQADVATLGTELAGLETFQQDVAVAQERVDALGSQVLVLAADMEDDFSRLRETRDQLNQMSRTLDSTEALTTQHVEAIDSIDAYRLQINQRLIQLEREVRSLTAE